MKKYLILTALFVLTQSTFCLATPSIRVNYNRLKQTDSLSAYIGKYQQLQGGQIADVYAENGTLKARSADGPVLTLVHKSGDDFVVAENGITVKFIRDKDNKVMQVAING